MKKRLTYLGFIGLFIFFVFSVSAKGPTPKATGDIWMSNPDQQIDFSAFDGGVGVAKGTVEYWNYDYPGILHYTAAVLCANVSGDQTVFVFQIPNDQPDGLGGLYVGAKVVDDGTPGTDGDLYGHTATSDRDIALGWCESGTVTVTDYPITAGNLVVHD